MIKYRKQLVYSVNAYSDDVPSKMGRAGVYDSRPGIPADHREYRHITFTSKGRLATLINRINKGKVPHMRTEVQLWNGTTVISVVRDQHYTN